ncbi:MAG TPA: hypothetical protein VIK20_07385 [Bacteroidales bacterium]
MKNLITFFLLFISSYVFSQEIICDKPAVANAYTLAINIVDSNTHDKLLAAGGDYGGEWVRDIAINSWNVVSLIRPDVAEHSLWSVTVNKDTIGHQYWDKIIWVTAAYNHYLATGDQAFLKQAYLCSAKTIKKLEEYTFDQRYGLFMGPSVFNDGIAGYPEPIYEPGNYSSYVLDHKNAQHIKCLSTNCVYYGAYDALAKMSRLLKENKAVTNAFQQKAKLLKSNILLHFYDKKNNTFNYLIDNQGKVDKSQEGLGLSFAVIFGIIDGKKACQLTSNAKISKYGITSISPDFPRYSAEKPGRHNTIIWPMVSGFFANASVVAGNYKSFDFELNNLTHMALDADKGNGDFREIYNPYTGKPDGGYQDMGKENQDRHWDSLRKQTWSATAYLNMVNYGLAGMRIGEEGISFSPYLPKDIHYLEIKNIPYRQSKIDLILKGNGQKIKSFLLNGKKQSKHFIDSSIKGNNQLVIELI